MRLLFSIIGFLIATEHSFAQKRVLDHSAPACWPIISSVRISNDGKYVAYKVIIPNDGSTLVIQATDHPWKKEIRGDFDELLFSKNSRWIILREVDNKIGIFDLLKDSIYYVERGRSFKIQDKGDVQWLACQTTDSTQTLILINLTTSQRIKYQNVYKYFFSPNGNVLLVEENIKKDGIPEDIVLWHSLADGKDKIINRSNDSNGFEFDNSGTKLIFFSIDQLFNQRITTLRYYQFGKDSTEILVDSSTPGMDGMFLKEGDAFFSPLGDKIFFYLQNKESKKLVSTSENLNSRAQVEVLGYQDDNYRFEKKNGPYLSVIDFSVGNFVKRLGRAKDGGSILSNGDDNNHVIFESNLVGSSNDYRWRRSARPDVYLVSTKDTTRKLLKRRLITYDLAFSYGGKYVIWFDRERKQWFTYNIVTSTLRNISQRIPTPLYRNGDYPGFPMSEGMAGWLANDEAVLIYDRFDIWKVDPDGINTPINLTRGYGASKNICFRLMNSNKDDLKPFNPRDTLFLTAFNYTNKYNGVFKITLSGYGRPEPLVMGNCVYYFEGIQTDFWGASDLFCPIKAKFENVYIVKRMSAFEYPNLYVTYNFKEYTRLTDFSPQKNYNWYKSELIHWKLLNGKAAEGVLFKPEDFNPHKKYPIIFFYYEKNANGLNTFIQPTLSNGVMNIPWFVSNGYLVFVPDIYYKVGHPGESAFNSVVSAALFMAKKIWVNSHKMGLQGHSFGGWETNYIITHTNLFRAAASSSGLSELVSSYGETLPSGDYFEQMQGRMGYTLWQKPALYIENSPFFKADKVSTPLLIMHNKGDYSVPYLQEGIWYHALNRLGKKVWMLSYDKEGHTIEKEKNQLDYSIRLGQFFDHYLKDASTPKWMSLGILPEMKGLDNGLEFGPSDKKPSNN